MVTTQEAAMRADGELGSDDMSIPTPNNVLIVLAQSGSRLSYRRPAKPTEGFRTDAPERFGFEAKHEAQLLASIHELWQANKVFVAPYEIVNTGPIQATHGKVHPVWERVVVQLG